MNRPKKTKTEIRADLENILAEIVAECYTMKDEFSFNNSIRDVYFKSFLIDKADKISEQKKFLNNIS
jgi:hypothetical protein